MLVKFVSNGTEIASMYVKKGDNMEQVLYDPGAGSSKVKACISKDGQRIRITTASTKAKAINDVRTEVNRYAPTGK